MQFPVVIGACAGTLLAPLLPMLVIGAPREWCRTCKHQGHDHGDGTGGCAADDFPVGEFTPSGTCPCGGAFRTESADDRARHGRRTRSAGSSARCAPAPPSGAMRGRGCAMRACAPGRDQEVSAVRIGYVADRGPLLSGERRTTRRGRDQWGRVASVDERDEHTGVSRPSTPAGWWPDYVHGPARNAVPRLAFDHRAPLAPVSRPSWSRERRPYTEGGPGRQSWARSSACSTVV